MYRLAWRSVSRCDPTDAAPEFLDIRDSVHDVCVIMCLATVMLQLVQET